MAPIDRQPLPPTAVFKHSKLQLAVRPDKPLYVAGPGSKVQGVLELACSSDKAWLGKIALEIRGAEQLQSLDHVASHVFLQADVAFQSPSLPPSNAVVSTAPSSGGYWPARKGVTRFPFSFPLPPDCPSSCTFGNNASITYTLQGTVQVQCQGERQVLAKRIEVLVLEEWSDWKGELYHEQSEEQRRERLAGPLGLGGEGSIWCEAIIPDRFFFRGWPIQQPQHQPRVGFLGSQDEVIERERCRSEICVTLSVKNGTSRTLSGVKLSLLRRMKILPSTSPTNGAPASAGAEVAPRITETVDELHLTGREWEFPSGGEERTVNCWIDVPRQEKFLSIRKTKLFEIQTALNVTVEMGALHKDIVLELPIWVVHYASLPREAFIPRGPHPISPTMPGYPASPQHTHFATQQHQAGSEYFPPSPSAYQPGFRPPSTRPVMSGSYSPNFQQYPSPASSPQPQQQQQYISFDPYAPNITQSSFLNAINQRPALGPPSSPVWQQQQSRGMRIPQRPASAMSYANSGYQSIGPLLSSSAPNTSFLQQYSGSSPSEAYLPAAGGLSPRDISYIPRSQSAQPYRDVRSSPQRSLSPGLKQYLSEEEQARVLQNSIPSFYDVGTRGRTLQRQQLEQQRQHQEQSLQEDTRNTARRQSMPAPSPPSTNLVRGNSFNSTHSAMRPIKTPPLAPSSSSRFIIPSPVMSDGPAGATFSPRMPEMDGLETIGEDGESQAGTLRLRNVPPDTFGSNGSASRASSGFLPRSASHETVRSLKAVKASGSSVDEDGNTSVTLLENIVDQQDRAKEAERKGRGSSTAGLPLSNSTKDILKGLQEDKTLPKPPVPSAKEAKKEHGPPRVYDIFPATTTPTAVPMNPSRRTSTPLTGPTKPRPIIKASNSESMLAVLETRLSRPSSPTTVEPTFRPMSLSPPIRSRTTSPVQRAVSPVHVGNEGALRKKSSQMSLKRKPALAAPPEDRPTNAETSRQSKVTLTANPRATLSTAKPSPVVSTPGQKALPDGSKEREVLREEAVSRVAGWARAAEKVSVPKQPLQTKEAVKDTSPACSTPSKATVTASEIPSSMPSPAFAKLSPHPIRNREASPGLRSPLPLSKRVVSDPQSSNAAAQRAPSPQKKEAQNRRKTYDVPLGGTEDGTQYDVRSQRGGRGGRVTSVASQWASLIAESEGTGGQATAKGAKNVEIRDRNPKAGKRHDLLPRKTPINSARVAATPAVRSQAPIRKALAPAPKAIMATTLVNNTMGKPATFAKAKPQAVLAPDSDATAKSLAGQTALGPGATRLRALIEKFS